MNLLVVTCEGESASEVKALRFVLYREGCHQGRPRQVCADLYLSTLQADIYWIYA